MNQGMIIGAIVILIVIGGGVFYMSRPQTNVEPVSETSMATVEATNEDTQTETEVSPTPATTSGSLKSLLSSTTSQQCNFQDTSTPSASSEGTVYVSQQKMRGDFSTTSNGLTQKSHIIIDGSKSYIWIDGQKQGFVTSFNATSTTAPTNASQSLDLNQKINFSCNSWNPDSSQFTRPSTVQFTDITEFSAPGNN